MPYNIPDNLGGDSPQNTKWMETCINSITGINKRTRKPYTESEKIAICKTALKKKKTTSQAEEEINHGIDRCIMKLMQKGKSFKQAEQEVLALAKKYEYDLERIFTDLS